MSHGVLIRGRQESKSQREMGRYSAANFKDGKGLWQVCRWSRSWRRQGNNSPLKSPEEDSPATTRFQSHDAIFGTCHSEL